MLDPQTGMTGVLGTMAGVVAPVFLCAAVGYAWQKGGTRFDQTFIGRLVMMAGMPPLIFSTLAKLEISAAAFGEMALLSALSLVAFGLIGLAILLVFRLSPRSYLPALIFGNVGNMGLPLCLFAYGDQGLALALGYFTVSAVGMFVVTPALASGSVKPGRLLRTPVYYAIAAGLACMFLEYTPPAFVMNTATLLGGMGIPLMLITLGASLAGLRVRSIRVSLFLAFLRLGMGAAVGFALAWLFDVEGMARGVFVIQCAMPSAVVVYIVAAQYERAPEEVAGVVLLSTGLSLPMILGLLLVLL